MSPTPTKPMRPLDRIDRRIIAALQRDGRIAITELAQQVGLSPTPCADRVRRLEREGIITGYHARIDPHALGAKMLVFLELRLQAKSGDAFEKARRELLRIPQILECHLISGDFDYLVKARIDEMAAYRQLLGEILRRLPGSAESRSYVVMEEIKETLELPLED